MADLARPTLTGLSAREVTERRQRGQANTPPPATTRTYSQILRENVFTFVNNVLFALGAALVLVGRPLDAVVSLGVIGLNTVVSVVQEVRAKRTLDRIALLTRPRAKAVRDGRELELLPEELVLGDLLRVGPGDQIVLDGRVLDGRMEVDESLLTGESELVPKQPGDAVYSGSFCVTGSATYEAVHVGEASLANSITVGARTFRRVLTPLQQQVNLVVRVLLLIVVYLQVLLALRALLRDVPLPEAIGDATVLASLVPNGLFLSIAIAYALGSLRIVRFGALVQQANAIESLSNVDVLCLDKTGTLTANRLKVVELHALDGSEDRLRSALATLAASASTKNKTSVAIADAFPSEPSVLVAEVPFSSARKWSAVALADGKPSSGAAVVRGVVALGAPEMLRPYVREQADGSPQWAELNSQAGAWADQGLRVLLATYHPDPRVLEDHGDATSLPPDMVPIGLVALSDELRPEARATLEAFEATGVRPKIISGDNPDTVAALARQAGLAAEIRTTSGPDLERMEDAELAAVADDTTIFGRISPQQKARLVAALRSRGRYVAMIGDGVNDVLSMKTANLAIAMHGGSQAARGVADIVLMNDSFASLLPAVREGQRIRNGMQDILKLFLTRIGTVALLIVASLVIGVFPIAVRNGSAVTLFSVGIPTLALALWAKPGPVRRRTLGRDLAGFTLPAALLSSLMGLLVFYAALLAHTGIPDQLNRMTLPQLMEALRSATPPAQTTLAAFLVACGLLLVVFVAPPSGWWAVTAQPRGDRRPFLLAIGLTVLFATVLLTPIRQVFALEALGIGELALVAAAVTAWVLLLRAAWSRHLVERFLSLPRD
jgi:cation-transporting P-type ATPase E